MSKSQYVAAPREKLDEIIRQAEARLDAQLTIGLAADQRAMTFASVLATGEAALIAWSSTHSWGDHLLWPLLAMMVGIGIAAGCALWSAQPIAWEMPGNTPESWVDDIADAKDDLDSAKAAMASFYADMIAWNDKQLGSNANCLRAALAATFLGLFIGGALSVAG